jgi:hypothetical protein
MVTKASLLDTIYLITDFLAGGVENSSTNLTSKCVIKRYMKKDTFTLLETMRHLLTEEQITLVRLKSKLVLMEHRNV